MMGGQEENIGELLAGVYSTFVDVEQIVFSNDVTRDLTLPEMATIEAIGIGQSYPMNVIAERVGVTMGTLTNTVNHLVDKGFVERKRSTTDRRQVLVSLTAQGRTAYRIRLHFHNQLIAQATDGLTTSERSSLISALSKVNTYLCSLQQEGA